MVHALREIHRLLRPAGILIDIHPHPEPEQAAVLHSGQAMHTEAMDEFESEDVKVAERALAEVVRSGVFVRERTEEFEFITHADSAQELHDCWDEVMAFDCENVDDAVLEREAQIFARLDQRRHAAGEGATVAMLERCRITRLRPVR